MSDTDKMDEAALRDYVEFLESRVEHLQYTILKQKSEIKQLTSLALATEVSMELLIATLSGKHPIN